MTSFNDLFGQYTVPPADAGYYAASISANAYLSWENNFSGATDELLAATFVDLSPASPGLSVTLPSATQVSTGTEILIKNSGSDALSILDNAANSVTSIAPGTIKYFMVTNNTTAAGVWEVFTFGTGTSTADALALAGYGLRVIASKLSADVPYQPVNSNYTVQELNRAAVIDVVAGAATVSLPSAPSLSTGFYTMVRNSSTGNVVIEPSGTELVDGLLSKTLAPSESLILICTGLAWISVGFGQDATFVFGEVVVNAAATSITLTSADVAGRMIRVAGTATANVTVNLPPVDNIYFVNVESGVGVYDVTFTTGSGLTTVLNKDERTVLYCDGTNVTFAVTTAEAVAVVTSLALADGSAASPSVSFDLDQNLGFYRAGPDLLGLTANGVRTAEFGTGSTAVATLYKSGTPDPLLVDDGLTISKRTADAVGGTVRLRKTRSTVLAGLTTVNSGDELGALLFAGTDGTSALDVAAVRTVVDGTPGTNDMPTAVILETTADGAATRTERVRIDSQGNIGLGVVPTKGIDAKVQAATDMVTTAGKAYGFNCYRVGGAWKYAANGYAAYMEHDASTGTISLYAAPNNVSGPGAALTGVVVVSGGPGGIPKTDTVVIVSTAQTAQKYATHSIQAAVQLDLPAAPSVGDWLYTVDDLGSETIVIGRNGSNIKGVAQNLTLDRKYTSFKWVYVDATIGWTFI